MIQAYKIWIGEVASCDAGEIHKLQVVSAMDPSDCNGSTLKNGHFTNCEIICQILCVCSIIK